MPWQPLYSPAPTTDRHPPPHVLQHRSDSDAPDATQHADGTPLTAQEWEALLDRLIDDDLPHPPMPEVRHDTPPA